MIDNQVPHSFGGGRGASTSHGHHHGEEIVSLLSTAVYTCDAQGRITYYNAAAAELWGRQPALGKEMWCGSWRAFYPDGSEMSLEDCPIAVTIREGRPVRGKEVTIERPDGTRRVIQPHPQPLYKGSGRNRTLVGALNMLVDVTRHKRLERALRDSRERQKQIIELLPAGVYTCEAPTGFITYYNERAAELWGREPNLGDLADRFCGSYRLMAPDGRVIATDQTPMADAIRCGSVTRNGEVVLERPDGSRLNVLVNIDPIRDEQGNIVGAINIFHDTTKWREAERERALLAAVVDSSDDAIISKNLDGTITTWNGAAERLYGYTAEEAIGQPITMLIPEDRQHEEHEILQRVSRGERVDTFTETVRLRKDGTPVHVSLTISPIRDSNGRIIGASKIARDITERKRVERELTRYREHLQELVEMRTRELANVQAKLVNSERILSLGTMAAGLGHDIGNLMMPMAVNLEAVRTRLGDVAASDEVQERMQAITKSFEYLRKLASGLRMMAIDPTKDKSASWRPTSLEAWWSDTSALMKTALTGRFTLECDFEPDLPPVAVPNSMLTQMVFNLVQNAGRAMADQRDGWVRILAAKDEDRGMVRLCVADNGPGMSEEVQRRCVEPFFTTRTRGISTGLGLALVQGMLTEAGGSLDIESTLGKGSTFTLHLPINPAEPINGSTKPVVTVRLSDVRARAAVMHVLQSLSVDIADDTKERSLSDVPQLLVIDATVQSQAAATALLAASEKSHVIIVSDESPQIVDTNIDRVTYLRPPLMIGKLQRTLQKVVDELTE